MAFPHSLPVDRPAVQELVAELGARSLIPDDGPSGRRRLRGLPCSCKCRHDGGGHGRSLAAPCWHGLLPCHLLQPRLARHRHPAVRTWHWQLLVAQCWFQSCVLLHVPDVWTWLRTVAFPLCALPMPPICHASALALAPAIASGCPLPRALVFGCRRTSCCTPLPRRTRMAAVLPTDC